jgi:Ser/Thr protein kinase RdoA (MazF antagonist)
MKSRTILSSWQLDEVITIAPVGNGLINTTYKVATLGGVFVLQKIHEIIPDAAAVDMMTVTSYLAEHGLKVPKLILTNDGQPFAVDGEGSRWRLYSWIEGVVVNAIDNEEMTREAGKVVGKMHGLLAKLDYTPAGSIPHFHETEYIVNELQTVSPELSSELATIAQDIIDEVPKLLLDESRQKKQVIHGDLKISNLLFDEAGKAVGVIDFDTILEHFSAVDLGDALRSWCNKTSEDDASAVIDEGLCEAALAGYAEGLGRALTTDERNLYLRATKLIALELASRFLIDVVRDNYFGFDSARYPDRRSHNIARAIGQYHLAQSIKIS